MKIRRMVFRFVILLIAFLWLMGFVGFCAIIPDNPATDNVQADAVVVLTGGALRLEHGFELLAEGRAPKIFISGVEDGVTTASLLHSKEYKEFAERVSPLNIVLGYKARSTNGNASEIAEWVAHENVTGIRLVTGNYHMPRSIHEIHQAAPTLIIIPDPVFPKHFGKNEWWRYGDSIRLMLSEYNKYLVSLIIH